MEFLSAPRFPVVDVLPDPTTSNGLIFEWQERLWFSDGALWLDVASVETSVLHGAGIETGETTGGGSSLNENIKALLHFNGADNSTSFTDETGRVWQVSGSAIVDADVGVFSQSGYFDGSGYVYTEENLSDFAFGTEDFTISFRLRTSATYKAVINFLDPADNGPNWQLYIESGGQITFYSDGGPYISGTSDVADDVFHDIEVSRSGGVLRIFVDGVLENSTADTTNYSVSNSVNLAIGSQPSNSSYNFVGWIDEVCIRKGEALHTAAYTPATEEFSLYEGTAPTLENQNDGIALGYDPLTDSLYAINLDKGSTAVETLQAEVNPFPQYNAATYISGLRMAYHSGTGITVLSGQAFVHGDGTMVYLSSDTTKTGLSTAANTWYHVYLFASGLFGDIEVSTTGPAAPIVGTARHKSGDSTRRYIGSVKTDASGNIIPFIHLTADKIRYQTDTRIAPMRILSAGTATTETNVSAAGCVPSTARIADIHFTNVDAGVAVLIGNSAASIFPLMIIRPGMGVHGETVLDSSQQVRYRFNSAPSGSFTMDVLGYSYDR